MSTIKVWGRVTCPPCKATKHWLNAKKHKYEEINVDDNLTEFAKLGFATVPVIEVDGRYFTNLPSLASYINSQV